MSKTKNYLALIFMMLISAQALFALSLTPATAATATPSLKIFAGPTSVPADNQAYGILAVQLQNSQGAPLRASADTEVRLSSSTTNVGTVDQTVTIPQGSTTASASFYATYTPGSTSITASATGYPTSQVTVTTVAPTPTTLAIYAFPPILPADGSTYQALFVQLQDSTGTPAKAPVGGIQATLTSSNATVATPDSSVTIPEGQTYVLANVRTSSPGTVTITATASGYTTAQAPLNVQLVGNTATSVKIYLAPPKIQADGNTYQQVALELQDSTGKLAQTSTDMSVTLASSNTAIATVDQAVTISAMQSFALGKFTTTYKAGTTTITATATNYTTSQATLTTTGSAPAKLAVFGLPLTLPADAQAYNCIMIQLQDSLGKPARDPTQDTTIYLSTSTPEAGNVTDSVTIPSGQTQATGIFTTTCAAGISTITAQASGYTSGQAKITTYLIDPVFLNVTVTADPPALAPGNQTTITAFVSYNGTGPALGATLNFTSSKVGTLTKAKEIGNGYYTSVFTAPKTSTPTICTISVNATKTGYNSTIGKTQVTVDMNFAQPKGTLVLQVLASNGSPVSAATVTSQTQPSGVQTLSSTTNSSGYVAFQNIPAGNYTLQIVKTGFATTTKTVQFTGNQTGKQNVNLQKNNSDPVSIPIVGGIAAAAVIAVIAVFMFMRKRHSRPVEAEDPQDQKAKIKKQ
ncbi:MAG TPA: carboxypeptidase regulatory-like domain-containing protein [Candidatus Nanoarchaeia archaeon]|nr:carboxypeptidase regulatory-like domain-containing protein [Candidatus Nanoarchaeia archaeon]